MVFPVVVREVRFFKRLVYILPLVDSVVAEGLIIGDVDNDGDNEIVVGSLCGTLLIFKGRRNEPWASATDLGSITCMAIGAIRNNARNSLVVINGEGTCHIFDFELSGEGGKTPTKRPGVIRPALSLRVPLNLGAILLRDVNGDGAVELVVSDRYHRIFILKLAGSVGNPRLEASSEVVLPSQVLSLTVAKTRTGPNTVLVAGMERGVAMIDEKGAITPLEFGEGPDLLRSEVVSLANGSLAERGREDVVGVTSAMGHLGFLRVSTPSFGLVGDQAGRGDATSNGTQGHIIVPGKLFKPSLLDITREGVPDLVACSWEGWTYVLPTSASFSVQEHVTPIVVNQFKVENGVRAFAAAVFSLEPSCPLPCFAYITVDNKLLLYVDVRLQDATAPASGSDMKDAVDGLEMQEAAALPGGKENIRAVMTALCRADAETLRAYRAKLLKDVQSPR